MFLKDKIKFGEERDNSYKVVFVLFVFFDMVLFFYFLLFGLIVLLLLYLFVMICFLLILYR